MINARNKIIGSVLGKERFTPNEDALAMVMGMGFTREQATKALKATDNNLERAADWIFSHQAELDNLEVEDESGHSEETFRDGNHRRMFLFSITFMYYF